MKFTPLLSVLPLLALAAPAVAAPTHGHGNRVAHHAAPIAQTRRLHLVRRSRAQKCGVPEPEEDDDDAAPAEGHTEAPAPEAAAPAPAEGEKPAEEHAEKPAEEHAEKPAEEHAEQPAAEDKPTDEQWKNEHPESFNDAGKHPEEWKPEHNSNIGHNLNAAPLPEHQPEEQHHNNEEHKPEEHHNEHQPEWKPEENHQPEHQPEPEQNHGGGGHHGEVFEGTATHYNVLNPWENEGYAPGTVACDSDRKFTNDEIFVALNWRQYDALGARNGACWRQVRITDESTGNSAVAQVVDRCGGGGHGGPHETCKWGDLDLSMPLWKSLHGDNNRGVFKIKWSWV